MKMSFRKPLAQRGFSILEVVIALGALGILTVAAWKLKAGVDVVEQTQVGFEILDRADRAIVAFTVRNARLPCPAAPGSGTEDCALVSGTVPWQTLNILDQRAGVVEYKPEASKGFTHISAPIPLLRMNAAKQVAVSQYDVASQGAQADRILDFCNALGRGLKLGVRTAYELRQPPAAPDAPEDWRIIPLASLWKKLSCGQHIAVSSRAHVNAAMAADMMLYAAKEKRFIAEQDNRDTEWAYISAVFDFTYQATRLALVKAPNAEFACLNAASIVQDMAANPGSERAAGLADATHACGFMTVDMATQATNVAAAGIGVSSAIEALKDPETDAYKDRRDHADQVAALRDRVTANAQASVYMGYYLK